MGEKLGAKVLIEHKTNGKGRLIVSYNSLDELDGILAHLIKGFVNRPNIFYGLIIVPRFG